MTSDGTEIVSETLKHTNDVILPGIHCGTGTNVRHTGKHQIVF